MIAWSANVIPAIKQLHFTAHPRKGPPMDSTSQIDESALTVTRSLRIEAPRELVFEVLTRPDQIAQWFGQRADFPDGVRAGAHGTFGWTDHGDFPARIESYDPPTGFAFTWGTPGQPLREDNSTTATFTLAEDGDATVLTVVESGFDTLGDAAGRRAAMEDNASGWVEELDQLATHVDLLVAGVTRPTSDLDAGLISRTVLVRAPQDVTWDVLTDEAAIEAWWGHPARFPGGGLRAGASGTFEWTGHGLMPMVVERFDAPAQLDLRWGGLGDDTPGPEASLVEFHLAPVGADRTLVTVVETGFGHLDAAARRAAMEQNVTGWTHVLDGLARHTDEEWRTRPAGSTEPVGLTTGVSS